MRLARVASCLASATQSRYSRRAEGGKPSSVALAMGLASSAFTNSKDLGQIREMQGTVKWYKPDQGFGFVTPEDGMKDVFIHKSCLERHGIIELRTGQRLLMTFRTVPKGREVTGFQILGS